MALDLEHPWQISTWSFALQIIPHHRGHRFHAAAQSLRDMLPDGLQNAWNSWERIICTASSLSEQQIYVCECALLAKKCINEDTCCLQNTCASAALTAKARMNTHPAHIAWTHIKNSTRNSYYWRARKLNEVPLKNSQQIPCEWWLGSPASAARPAIYKYREMTSLKWVANIE